MKKSQIPKLAGTITEHQHWFETCLTAEGATTAIRKMPDFIRCACNAWNEYLKLQPVFPEQMGEWKLFYQEVFGFTDVSSMKVSLPDESLEFRQLVVIRKGLTLNKVLVVMRTMFNTSSYSEDLDSDVPTNDRVANIDYAFAIRGHIEADEELKNLSANQIAGLNKTAENEEDKINGMTLLERLVFGLFYFWKKKREGKTEDEKLHLDIKNITLCTGSRGSDGGIPSVSWTPGSRGVLIRWYRPDYSLGLIRARAVRLPESSNLQP